MRKIILTLLIASGAVHAQAPIIVDPTTGQYLGTLSANKFDPDSVSNVYGRFGSPYSSTSINNRFSPYGSPYSNRSVRNPYAPSTQPVFQPTLPTTTSLADTWLEQTRARRHDDDQFEQMLLTQAMILNCMPVQNQAAPTPLPPMPLLDFSVAPASKEEFDALPAWRRATFEAAWNGKQFTQETLQRFVIEQMAKEIEQLRAAAKQQDNAVKATDKSTR